MSFELELQQALDYRRLTAARPRGDDIALAGDGGGIVSAYPGDHIYVRYKGNLFIARNFSGVLWTDGQQIPVDWLSTTGDPSLLYVDYRLPPVVPPVSWSATFDYVHAVLGPQSFTSDSFSVDSGVYTSADPHSEGIYTFPAHGRNVAGGPLARNIIGTLTSTYRDDPGTPAFTMGLFGFIVKLAGNFTMPLVVSAPIDSAGGQSVIWQHNGQGSFSYTFIIEICGSDPPPGSTEDADAYYASLALGDEMIA